MSRFPFARDEMSSEAGDYTGTHKTLVAVSEKEQVPL